MRSWLLMGSVFTVGVTSGAVALEACSLQTSGSGETPDSSVADAGQDAEVGRDADAGQDADAPRDTGPPEAAPCTGLHCAGQCLDAGDCRSCSGAPLLCGATGTCVPSCAGCRDPQGVATPVECFACDTNHANPIGTCQDDDAGSYCLSGDYTGQYQGGTGDRCGCNDVSGCPGATQVCVPLGHYDAGFCLTCGEATIGPMQGQPCRDGGTCQASQALCQ